MIMDFPVWLIWFAVSAALFIVEMLTATFFILCFSLGALAAAIAAALGAGQTLIWAVFVAVSGVTVFYSRALAEKFGGTGNRSANADQLIGSTGRVLVDVNSINFDGKVTVSGARWSAKSESQQSFKEGEEVKVAGMEGAYLIVTKGEE